MVDAENSFFVERAEQNAVEPLRADEVRPEWLLHNDARSLRDAAGLSKLLHDDAKERWRNRKIERGLPRGPERLADGLECGRVVVIAVHVAQQAAQFLECSGVKPAMFFEAIFRPGLELVEVPARFGDADDRQIKVAALQHRLESREDFLVSQVASGAKKHQSIGVGCIHGLSLLRRFFQVAAEAKAHRRKQFVLEIRLPT